MATSDGAAAVAVLDTLTDCGIQFAVLHDEAAIASGSFRSDIDLVVDRDPRAILAEHGPDLHRVGLHPIVLWPYDVASTATVFLARPDGSNGVQLDLLCDSTGIGKYGVRSMVLLEEAVPGERWPIIRPSHQLLYLLRKRSYKGARDEVVRLRGSLADMGSRELAAEVDKVFSPRAAASVRRILDCGPDGVGKRVRGASPFRDGARWVRRLLLPIGFWTEIVGEGASATALALSARFRRYLPWTRAERRPGAAVESLWWCRDVMPVRWRAGLFVSWSPTSGRVPRPDATVRSDGRSLDEIGGRVVTAMERRLRL